MATAREEPTTRKHKTYRLRTTKSMRAQNSFSRFCSVSKPVEYQPQAIGNHNIPKATHLNGGS